VPERESGCVVCGAELPFEDLPPVDSAAGDSAGADVCARCAAAEIVAPMMIRVLMSAAGSGVVPQQRRAA
jgi:hypothetical protein